MRSSLFALVLALVLGTSTLLAPVRAEASSLLGAGSSHHSEVTGSEVVKDVVTWVALTAAVGATFWVLDTVVSPVLPVPGVGSFGGNMILVLATLHFAQPVNEAVRSVWRKLF